MGVIVSKDQDKTKLQKHITASLRNRTQSGSDEDKSPDLAKDSAYLKGLKKTGRFSWIWIVLIVLAIIALIVIVIPV